MVCGAVVLYGFVLILTFASIEHAWISRGHLTIHFYCCVDRHFGFNKRLELYLENVVSPSVSCLQSGLSFFCSLSLMTNGARVNGRPPGSTNVNVR